MDVQKAYDTVEWIALKHIMQELNLHGEFIDWIMLCLTTVTYRYATNGQISRKLKAKRGPRHGDPISHILFVLIMEYLHKCLAKL